ncbi:hypothetical protein AB0T83_01910 [Fluviibacterium sp. DFM31]|uniref:DUF1127 domain-containing protein n=1 Tax=Meridianimarinicoccus marinus TaxID=3231483 RepID=A0ABV3L1V4_9RHOB
MAQSLAASNPAFLSGPLQAVAEMFDKVTWSDEFRDRVADLSALSDRQLARRGLRRSEISRHVLRQMSMA